VVKLCIYVSHIIFINTFFVRKYIYLLRYIMIFNLHIRKISTVLISKILFFIFFAAIAHADVIVHDMIALKGEEIMLKVETKGKFFPKGGEIVEFFIDGKSIGKSLSGGDGFALKQFKPLRPATYQIFVRSGKEEGKGLLLSLKKNDEILFVDVEGSLFEGGFSEIPKKGSQETIKKLSVKFPVILLQTRWIGIKTLKGWLKENGFIDLPIIPWKQGMIFDEIKEQGLKIKAVIGSAPVIESARALKTKAFSFEEVQGAVEVKSWEDIRKKLR
jgi:hypothetical protein